MFKGCFLEADTKSESAASKQCAVVQILEINIKIWIFVLKYQGESHNSAAKIVI